MDALLRSIKENEITARVLDLTPASWREHADEALDVLKEFLGRRPEDPAFQAHTKKSALSWDHRFTVRAAIEYLVQSASSSGSNHRSPRNFAYFVSGGLPVAALARFAATVTNCYTGKAQSAPEAVRLENHVVRWLLDLVNFPESSFGNLTSGGSAASLSAILVARDKYRITERPDERFAVYMSKLAHGSIQRALHIVGASNSRSRLVGIDRNFCMDVAELRRLVEADRRAGIIPWLIVATAGTTLAGSIDPLESIYAVAQSHGMWMHVDAAYGGMFTLAASAKERLTGMANADSVTINPHKGMFLPHGVGTVLVRDGSLLSESFNYTTQDCLLPESGLERDPSHSSPELTRPWRGAEVWLPLAVFGQEVFAAALEEKLQLAQFLYLNIRSMSQFEVGPFPETSVVLFRYALDADDGFPTINERLNMFLIGCGFNQNLVEIDGRQLVRVAILNYATHLDHVQAFLSTLAKFPRVANALTTS